MKTIFQAIIFAAFANGYVVAQPPDFNRVIESNGLKGNLFVHDPVMIKQGGTYYIFSTGMGIKTSKDRVNWTNAGSVFGSITVRLNSTKSY